MTVSIVEFTPDHLGAVTRFWDRYYPRPRAATFYRWRYLDAAPLGPTYLALQDGDCISLVSSLRKRYLAAGREASILEVFDWHALPEQKGSGAGLRVMIAMMRRGDPVMAIGGTADVLSALPLMKWKRLGACRLFYLPISADVLAAALQRRTRLPRSIGRIPMAIVERAWFHPRRRRHPMTGAVTPVQAVDDAVNPLYAGDTGYGLVQFQPQTELLRWQTTDYAGNGQFVSLYFRVGANLRGWAMTRIYEGGDGMMADIVDLFAPRPDADLYAWMVAEAALSVLPFAPRRIRARASCPLLCEALRRNHFLEEPPEVPVHVFPNGLSLDLGPVHLTLNHTDEPLRPYPDAE